jgi:hypothetical protein
MAQAAKSLGSSFPQISHLPLRHDPSFPQAMTLHQGDCVHLTSDEHLYQVIGVDDHQNRCWVRRWPMARHGSPVFEISLHLVDGQPIAGHPRPTYPVGARSPEAQGHGSLQAG